MVSRRTLKEIMAHTYRKNDCLIWRGTKSDRGYGRMLVNGKTILVHRWVKQLVLGHEIPHLFVVRHTCDNPSCVNPDHLILGTQKDNIADREARNRRSPNITGSKNSHAKLTENQVTTIRNEYMHGVRGHGSVVLGKKYGVSDSVILDIVNRKTWKHI